MAVVIEKTVYEERTRKLQSLMAELGIDGFMVVTGPDYLYFTGDYRRQPRAFIPQKGDPILLVFEAEAEEAAANSWIKDVRTFRDLAHMMKTVHDNIVSHDMEHRTIAMEFRFHLPAFMVNRFKAVNKGGTLVDSTPVTAPLRMYKSEEEISLMREAARIAGRAMDAAISALRVGVRESEIAAEADYTARKLGASAMCVPTFVNSGPRSLWVHGGATDRRIGHGELVLIDIMPSCQGYCSDLTRMAIIGDPTPEQRHIHKAYVRAAEEVAEAMQPGRTVQDLDKVALSVFHKEGLEKHWIRLMTHGIGLDFEETPTPTIFPPDGRIPIENGMVLSVGHSILAIPGIGGVRIEDVLRIKDGKACLLTSYPTELIAI